MTTTTRAAIRIVDGKPYLVAVDGAALRALREQRGHSLDAIGLVCSCSRENVRQWESEGTIPSGARIEALQAHYGDAVQKSGALVLRPAF